MSTLLEDAVSDMTISVCTKYDKKLDQWCEKFKQQKVNVWEVASVILDVALNVCTNIYKSIEYPLTQADIDYKTMNSKFIAEISNRLDRLEEISDKKVKEAIH